MPLVFHLGPFRQNNSQLCLAGQGKAKEQRNSAARAAVRWKVAALTVITGNLPRENYTKRWLIHLA